MNRAIFWRLMWKEYRLQRAFWIAMAALALMLMLLAWQFNDRADDCALWYFYIALATPVFYVLGCASTTFAGEFDAETYEFQRSMPVKAMQVFWSKVALAFLSTFAMFVLLSILAFCLAGGRVLDPHVTIWEMRIWETLAIACMGAWLYMVWGIFFSLILKRPLLAAIVSVTVASMGSYAIAGIMQIQFPSRSFLPMQLFVVLTAFLAVVNILLGRRWLRDKMWPAFGVNLPTKIVGIMPISKSMTLEQYISRSNFWTIFRRLTWQHWRQSCWLAIVVLVMLAPLILALIQLWLINKYSRSGIILYHDWVDFCMTISIPLAVAMPPLVASFTFLADQRQRSLRFFAERGIGPRMVWFSRLWPWLIIIVPFCLIVILACLFTNNFFDRAWNPRRQEEWFAFVFPVALVLFGYPMLSLCVGQFCSMFFRSGFLAGLFSLIITAFLMGWSAYMWMWGMNLLWSVLPIPVILLLATWLRAPDWVLERNAFASWLKPGLVLAVPTVVLLTVVPLYRVYQVPAVDPGFSISEFDRPLTPEEQATRRLFEKAEQSMDLTIWNEIDKEEAEAIKNKAEEEGTQPVWTDYSIPKELSAKQINFVKANQETISLLIEAGKGAEKIASYRYPAEIYNIGLPIPIENLLIYSAMMLESDGQLDAALDRYLSAIRISKQYDSIRNEGDDLECRVYEQLPLWANRSGQTPERIKNAVRQVEKLTADMPAGDGQIKYRYIGTRKSIREGMHNMPNMQNPFFFLGRLPWERARALRLLNLITLQDLEAVRRAVQDAKNGIPIDIPWQTEPYPNFFTNSFYERELLSRYFWRLNYSINRQYAAMENNRRATRIVLALQAWKLEHGAYPKTLDELVGPYFEKLPNDPFSGESYQYFPQGVKDWMNARGINFELLSPGKGKPVVWSTDFLIKIKSSHNQFLNKYWIYDPRPYEGQLWRDPTSLYDILSHGRCFLVP